MQCNECSFWLRSGITDPDDDRQDSGHCRRYPPVMNATQVAVDTLKNHESFPPTEAVTYSWAWAFPITDYDEWCGEFKSKHE